MKYYLLLISLLLSACTPFYTRYPSLPEDNPVEEYVEYFIEKRSGIFIDFSPGSREESYGN